MAEPPCTAVFAGSYVQNHAILNRDGEPLLGAFRFDIFSEVEFASADALAVSVSSAYYQDVVLTDEACLLDASNRAFLMTERRGDGSTGLRNGAIKLVQFRTATEGEPSDADPIGTGGASAWSDRVTQVAGWPGIQPAVLHQFPFASVEAAMDARSLLTDDAVIASVNVEQIVIVRPVQPRIYQS